MGKNYFDASQRLFLRNQRFASRNSLCTRRNYIRFDQSGAALTYFKRVKPDDGSTPKTAERYAQTITFPLKTRGHHHLSGPVKPAA
jgi:hypothetical protein